MSKQKNVSITYGEILNSFQSLSFLFNDDSVRGSASLKLARNIKELEEERESFNKALKKLQDQYAETDDEGEKVREVNHDGQESLVFTDEEAFNEEVQSLVDQEVEVNLYIIPIEELGENTKPSRINTIDFMLTL